MGPYFIDTFFIQAVLNPNDPYHGRVLVWRPVLRESVLWTTEAVLTEVGNALSKHQRERVSNFIASCYSSSNIHVVTITPELFQRGLELYRQRPDKEWGLTDCISFVVMRDHNLVSALTGDRHFEQAGFVPVLLQQP